MKDLLRSTSGGKAGAVDGLNLFFGALLGANLGTIQGMGAFYYVVFITLLAGMVMTVRMLSTSPRRTYMLVNVILLWSTWRRIPAVEAAAAQERRSHRSTALPSLLASGCYSCSRLN